MPTLSNDDRTVMPIFEDTADAPHQAVIEDRRNAPRDQASLFAQISGLGSKSPVLAEVVDISEAGLYLCLPCDVGVCVGQRCELVLSASRGATNQPACVDESFYATVVRTVRFDSDTGAHVGAGFRFDNQIFL